MSDRPEIPSNSPWGQMWGGCQDASGYASRRSESATTIGEVWCAQFARINNEGSRLHLSCWAPTPKGINNTDYLGVLLFE